MNCPRCAATVLSELDRDGITVDVCPACRGVWLDRGELERLRSRWLQELEREFGGPDVRDAALASPRRDERVLPAEPPRQRYRDDDDDDDDDDRRDRHRRDAGHEQGAHPPRRRRWFEMFDLFD